MPPVTSTLFGCFIDEEGSIKRGCTSLLAFRLLMFRIADVPGGVGVPRTIRKERLATGVKTFSRLQLQLKFFKFKKHIVAEC